MLLLLLLLLLLARVLLGAGGVRQKGVEQQQPLFWKSFTLIAI